MSPPLTADNLKPALQTFSIIAVALAAGTNLSTSVVSLPVLYPSDSSTLATQWKTLFDKGITPVVSCAMSAGAGFAALAYQAMSTPALTSTGLVSHTRRNLYVAASVTAFGLAPYTRILMWDTNEKLAKRASTTGTEGKGDTHALVRKWDRLNFWRGVMLLSSAVLGTWASVS